MIWSDKYRPSSVMEMIGNESARIEAVAWLSKWRTGTKPLLLVGPPGTGKTTLAFLLAEQFGYDVVGLNASDVRNKSKINEILNPVLENSGVTGRPLMIFIDEVDGVHGRSDYGGSAALATLLKNPSVPIILAANDDSADKMKSVKKAATLIEFRRVPPRLLRAYLEHIIRLEDTGTASSPTRKLTYGTLIMIVGRSRGDMRSLINLAQSYATGFSPPTETPEDALTVEQAVPAFFAADSVQKAADILAHMRSDPREKINAFYSSIITTRGLAPERLASLLRVISEADMLYGRIMRTQNWRLLRYLNGILVKMYDPSSKSTEIKYTRYNISWPLMSRIQHGGSKIRSLAAAMNPLLHVSASTFGSMHLPLMLYCMNRGSLAVPDEKEDPHGEIIAKEAARLAR